MHQTQVNKEGNNEKRIANSTTWGMERVNKVYITIYHYFVKVKRLFQIAQIYRTQVPQRRKQ